MGYDHRITINKGKNRLDSVVASICSDEMNDILNKVNPNAVLVQGDTVSAFAVALAAFHRGIKVIHLEAGLRTYDKSNPMPEESYRKSISSMADIHLCPTETAADNLKREGIKDGIFITGNTVLDSLPSPKCVTYGKRIVVTLHRRENIPVMKEWFKAVSFLAGRYPEYDFVIPLHPNPKVREHKEELKRIIVFESVTREVMVEWLMTCAGVITDSGGIQEEASWFKKNCVVCRKVTERVETIGKSSELAGAPSDLSEVFADVINRKPDTGPCPFGDGKASLLIAKILKDFIQEICKK